MFKTNIGLKQQLKACASYEGQNKINVSCNLRA